MVPRLGGYFFAVTFVAGAYPSGWLYGVDIPLPELQNLLTRAPRSSARSTPAVTWQIGPFGGLGFLSGMSVYGVALGLPPGSGTPSMHSPAVTYTIP